MLKRYLLTIASLLYISASLNAAPKEKNISISKVKQYYEFVFNPKTGQVEVKQKLSTSYYCNDYRESVPVAEVYNDQMSIDNVNISVRGVKPSWGYYGANDVFFSDERVCYFELPLDKQGATGTVTFDETVRDPKYFTEIFF